MARIGLVGPGAMGGPMVRNFIAQGHSVLIVARRAAAAAPFVALGARHCEIGDLADEVDAVFTVIPRGTGHEALYFDAGGLLETLRAGTLLVDCATAAPETARRIAEAAARRGLRAIDAPVSGGVRGATQGTLTFMAGGSAADVAALRPLVTGVGDAVIHLGPAGSGQAAKICNNMIAGAITAATCEGFALAEKMGVDLAKLFDVMSRSSARSWVLENLCPVPGLVPDAPSSHGYRPGGQSQLLLKDMTLATEAAQALGVAIPVASLARSLYQIFCSTGNGEMDSSALIQLIQGRLPAGRTDPVCADPGNAQ